jgi:hypothetical protein
VGSQALVIDDVLATLEEVAATSYASDVVTGLFRAASSIEPWPEDSPAGRAVGDLPTEVEHLEVLAGGFAYRYLAPGARSDGPFRPSGYRRRGEEPWPAPLDQVTEDFFEIWEAYASAASAPFAGARLQVLTSTPQRSSNTPSGRCACWSVHSSSHMRQDRTIYAIAWLPDHSRTPQPSTGLSGRQQAGVSLGMLEPLVLRRIAGDEVAVLLERAREAYGDDPT